MGRAARRAVSARTLEMFSYVRMWFYERETRELVRINQCELIESFLDAQRDYAAGVALALVSEVTEAVLGEREVAEQNFRLLLLDRAGDQGRREASNGAGLLRVLDCAARRLDAGARSAARVAGQH